MAARIAFLESSAAKAEDGKSPAPTVSVTGSSNKAAPATVLHSEDFDERFREDVLLEKGSSSLYFNEILVSKFINIVYAPRP